MKKTLFIFLLMITALTFAQKKVNNSNNTNGQRTAYLLEVDDLEIPIDNKGVIADVQMTSEIGVKYKNGRIIFSQGFYLSGYTNGTAWGNGVATASLIENYNAIKYNGTDNSILLFEKENPFTYDWNEYSSAVSNLNAPFHDGDGDGVYNPVDLNNNGKWDENEDSPYMPGDRNVWSVFEDSQPVAVRTRFAGVEPQGIVIQKFVYTIEDDNELSKNIYYEKFIISNNGSVAEKLEDVYFTPFMDADIGYEYSDDLFASVPEQNAIYIYGKEYDAAYGRISPGLLYKVLAFNNQSVHNMKSTMLYLQSDPDLGDPDNVSHFMNYVQGLGKDGNIIDPCSSSLGEVYGIDCAFVDPHLLFSGNIATNEGWIYEHPSDIRGIMSYGPFDLTHNSAPVEFDLMIAVGDSDENNFESRYENVLAKANYMQQYFDDNILAIDDNNTNSVVPTEFSLSQNYPNPFNPSTTISFSLPEAGNVKISIFNILGEKVAVLADNEFAAGLQNIKFNASELPSGIYIYQMEATSVNSNNNIIISKKMTLMK